MLYRYESFLLHSERKKRRGTKKQKNKKREKRERIGGENEKKSLTGGEGMEVIMKTVSAQERIEGGEVTEKMGLEDGKRVCVSSPRHLGKVGDEVKRAEKEKKVPRFTVRPCTTKIRISQGKTPSYGT